MLPILRILPVGGVFLAIAIVVLALGPPIGSRSVLTPTVMPARGALLQARDHPEWRQFLMLAAIQRADELSRLRDLPDLPVHTQAAPDAGPDAAKVAGLPADRNGADPEYPTGSIAETPNATIPIEIGETSSTELPVRPVEERPPVVRTPPQTTAPNKIRTPAERRSRRAKSKPVARGKSSASAKPGADAQFNLFRIHVRQPAGSSAEHGRRAARRRGYSKLRLPGPA